MKYPTRREILTSAALAFMPMPTAAWAESADGAVIEAWMETWMAEQRRVVGTLHLSRFVEPMYFLLKPTIWLPEDNQKDRFRSVTVPVGFVTDFASIPRVFWALLRPDGRYTHAAIVHDYLYWTQTTSREAADEIFRIMMEDFSIENWMATTIYYAVRLGGGTAWESSAKARMRGEKRVLKRFPEDPRTKWQDWQRMADVFE